MLNNLIPIYLYQGHRVGRPERLYDYVLAEQGIIKRVETPFVSADHLLVSIQEDLIGLRLATYPLNSLRLKAPRIPGSLLKQVLAEARHDIDREVMAHFRFTRQGWQVTYPEQAQSRVRVGYAYDDPATVVLDLHSHHRMGAFFSPTDDEDEQGGRFYAVIGRIDQPQPELILRLGMYGHWLTNVPALTLFDNVEPFVEIFQPEGEFESYADPRTNTGWLATLLSGRST